MSDILGLVTPLALAVAVLSGIAFGLLLRVVVTEAGIRVGVFLLLSCGVFWYVPQAAVRYVRPEDFANGVADRTVGAWLLFSLFAGIASLFAGVRRG